MAAATTEELHIDLLGLSQPIGSMLVEGVPTTPQTFLVSLPGELLEIIAGHLEWEDVQRIRKVCKILYEVSKRRSVWYRIFKTTLPRPFFLPRPLEEYSSSDLERVIVTWESPWVLGADPFHYITTPISLDPLGERRPWRTSRGISLVPGGRWALVWIDDGSLWYYDLDDAAESERTPKLLFPAPEPNIDAEMLVDLEIAVDYNPDTISHDTLVASPGNELNHVTHFNVLVIATYRGAQKVDNLVRVSRVEVEFEKEEGEDGRVSSRAVGLRLVSRLATFPTFAARENFNWLYQSEIRGSMLAYSAFTESHHYIVIVDWVQANGKSYDASDRWYIQATSTSVKMHFLPYDRLLVTDPSTGNIDIYNWRSDCPTRSIPPHSIPITIFPPSWTYYFPELEPPDRAGLMLRIHNDIRVPISSASKTYGLSIPVDPRSDRAPEIELLTAHSRTGNSQFLQGYHRGIGVPNVPSQVYTIHYSWADESSTQSAAHRSEIGRVIVDVEDESLPHRKLLFDEFSGRVLTVNHVTHRYRAQFVEYFLTVGGLAE